MDLCGLSTHIRQGLYSLSARTSYRNISWSLEAARFIPESEVHGANMGPIWGRQDPGGPHVGPMNLAIWDVYYFSIAL